MDWNGLAQVIVALASLTGLVAGVSGFVKAWRTTRAAARKDVVASQQEEIARLCVRVDSLEQANAELRQNRDETLEANAELRGQVLAIQMQNEQLLKMNTDLGLKVEVQRAQIQDFIAERDKLLKRVDELETTLKNLQAPLPGLDVDGHGHGGVR